MDLLHAQRLHEQSYMQGHDALLKARKQTTREAWLKAHGTSGNRANRWKH